MGTIFNAYGRKVEGLTPTFGTAFHSSSAVLSAVNTVIYYSAFVLEQDCDIDALKILRASSGAISGSIIMGIYSADSTTAKPKTLLFQAPATTAVGGDAGQHISVFPSRHYDADLYWIASKFSNANTLISATQLPYNIFAKNSTNLFFFTQTVASGLTTLPTTATPVVSGLATNNPPEIMVRYN